MDHQMPRPKVVMFPGNHDLIQLYAEKLRKLGADVAFVPSFHYAAPWSFLKLTWLRLRGYSIIHTHWLFFYPSWLIWPFMFWARLIGYKVIWEVHNVEPHEGSIEVRGRARGRFFRWADAVILHFARNLEETQGLFGEPRMSKIIPHPLFDVPDAIPSREEARKRLELPTDGRHIFLSYGAIRAYKGYETLLKALPHIQSDAVFVIAGRPHDASLTREIEEVARNDRRLRVIGRFLTTAESDALFAAADACVQPHTEITTSGVVMLSLSHGRPVICSRIGGNAEIVEDGRTGLFCEPGDPHSLARVIDSFCDGALTLDASTMARVRERYSPDSVASAFYSLYVEVGSSR